MPAAGQMLAAVYRGHRHVQVENVPRPEIGPGELLVRVRACGVCGTDLKKIHFDLLEPPRIYGHETAGEIVEVGDAVDGWRVGDRVAVLHHVPCGSCFYCARRLYAHCAGYRRVGVTAGFEPAGGGFAEYVRVMDWIVPRGVVRVPDHIADDVASFVEPLNTVLKGLRTLDLQPEETILVIGQGPIGLLFTQAAKLAGLRVYATDPLEPRRKLAETLGVLAAWDPRRVDAPATLAAITEGRGADAAVVTVPSVGVVANALEAVRPGGRVLLFAQTRLRDPAAIDAGQVCALEKTLLGSYSGDIDLQAEAAELIFSGRVLISPLITHRVPLAHIREGLEIAARPRNGSMKVVIEP